MINLRPYQNNIIKSLRNEIKLDKKRLILCAPTGAGKTIMFTYMVKNHIERGGNCLVLTHRLELLTQTGGCFDKFDLDPEYITSNSKPDLSKNLHVAMVETLYRRRLDYADFIRSKTLIVIDEAHFQNFDKIFPSFNENAIVIGATATPLRDSKQNSLDKNYNSIVQEVDTPDLIDSGFLVKAETYGKKIDLSNVKVVGNEYQMHDYYEETKMYDGVIHNYKKYADGKKSILFSSNVNSSKKVCEELNKAGYLAKHIDGYMGKKERKEILEWFKNSKNGIICNCGILTAGYDQPDIECVILYRATKSKPLFLQMCGRGSRLSSGKDKFIILDFGDNSRRMGLWNTYREWKLSRPERIKKDGLAPTKDCSKCKAINSANAKFCCVCNHKFKEKIKEFTELELMQGMSKSELMIKAKRSTIKVVSDMCKAKLISPFWVLHNITDINKARLFIKEMGYKNGFEYNNKNRFNVFRR